MSPKLKRSLRRYLKAREELVPAGDAPPPHLFLSEKGERLTENTLRRRLYSWVRKSGIKKQDVKHHDLSRAENFARRTALEFTYPPLPSFPFAPSESRRSLRRPLLRSSSAASRRVSGVGPKAEKA